MDDSAVSTLSDLSAINDAASARFDAAMVEASTPSSTPEPSSSPAPAPAEATNAPVEAETTPTPEGTNPKVAVEPATPPEPTAHEKWVAKYGDPNKAADAAWEANNRLAAQAKEIEELKAARVQPAAPNAPAEPQAQPETPALPRVVEAAPEQVEQWVGQFVAQDETCKAWDQAFRSNNDRIATLTDPKSPESIASAAKEIQRLENWLELPQVADDPFTKSEYAAKLANTRAEYQARRLEAQSLGLENRDLKSQFEYRAHTYRSQIHDHYQTQKRAAQAEQESQQQITRHATDLSKAWDPAVVRTVEKFKIPESEITDFKDDLRARALASLESGIAVEDLDAFMGKEAQRLVERMDRNHRNKAAEYAKLATQRASQPAPAPSVVPQVQPTMTGDPLEDLYRRVDDNWRSATP